MRPELAELAELHTRGRRPCLVLTSRRVVQPGAVVNGHVVIDGDLLVAVGAGPPPPVAGAHTVDLGDDAVVPGLVEIHVHGMAGTDAASTEADGHLAMAAALAARGVTTYLPTVAAMDPDSARAVLAAVARAKRAQEPVGSPHGATIVGLHLEGPFLNPAFAGAMSPDCLSLPSIEAVARLAACAPGALARVTLAPELPGALALIGWLAERGVNVSGGHTGASYEETTAGIDAGISAATHLFNAMAGFAHRSPGPAMAYLGDPRVVCEVIADGFHLHPGTLRLAVAAAGVERLALVSDAVAPCGLSPGVHQLFGSPAILGPDGSCRRHDGTLAGSAAPPLQGLHTLTDVVGLPLDAAMHMAATTPARVAGLKGITGALVAGLRADLVVLGGRWRPEAVMVGGTLVA